MCTELALALLYFLTIFIVNYFLYKLLKGYIITIFYLLKIKNIYTSFPSLITKNSITTLLYLYRKESRKNPTSFLTFQKIFETEDVLFIGNLYAYCFNELKKENRTTGSSLYYFQLLENQYLSKPIDLKYKI